MDGQDKPDVPALIRGAARSPADRARWLDLLLARYWPGGGDRYEPAGRAWVRAWGPRRAPMRHTEPLACHCATGRCGVCN
jgi:hypothetical protein